MKRALLVLAILAMVATVPLVAADYIGAAKCKMCHKVEFASWSEMKHAKAFDLLKPEDQGNAECLKCHATGGNVEMPGVQCEACHGPGSEYKSMKVMKDADAAMAAGLVKPGEATCKACHEGAPHDQKAFDYAASKDAGRHAVKEK